jgi:hypothetical protein
LGGPDDMAVLPKSEIALPVTQPVPAPARSETRVGFPRRAWFRQHRRAAFWLLGIFALSQAVLAVFVDQRAPAVRDPEFYLLEGMLRDRMAERPGKPTAMFLGSSRVAHGFDAVRATGNHDAVVFNFGIPGSGPYFQTVMMDRMREDRVRTDILFLEVLHSFYNSAGVRSLDGSLLDGARLSYGEAVDLLHYGKKSKTGPLRRWALARVLPIYRHQAELRDLVGLDVFQPGEAPDSPFGRIDALGYRERPIDPAMWGELTWLAHKQYDDFYRSFEFDTAAWSRLVGTIGRARASGTDVVVVMMPEGSQFRRMYAPEVRAGVEMLIRRLRDEVGVTVIDAREWLDDSAFYDHHHLLPGGARTFADRFRTDALEPAMLRAEKRIAGPS